jgi:hypothetical protein
MKKIQFIGLPAAALVFVMVLTGCPNPNTKEQDTWTEASDVNALAGNWKGSGSIPIPAQSIPIPMDEDGSTLPISAFSMGIAMTISYTADAPAADVSMKMDMGTYLDAMAKAVNDSPEIKGIMALGAIMVAMDDELSDEEQIAALTDLGLSQADMATLMGAFISGDEDAIARIVAKITITKDHVWAMSTAGIEPTPEKYYYTVEETISTEELLGENVDEKIYINQDGTKLKLTIPKEQFDDMNMDIANDVELILDKQK